MKIIILSIVLLLPRVALSQEQGWSSQQNTSGFCGAPTMSISGAMLNQSDDSVVCGEMPSNLVTCTANEIGIFGGASELTCTSQLAYNAGLMNLGDGTVQFRVVQQSNASHSATYEWWKDATPTFAVAAGNGLPGASSVTNDLVVSAWNGVSWAETARFLNGGGERFVNMTAPSTPASGTAVVYADGPSKNLAVKNDAGIVNHGAQSVTQAAGLALSALADDGSWSKLAFQPPLTACTNYVSVSCQGGTSDVGTGGSNSAVENIALHDGSLVRWATAGGWANGFYLGLSGSNIRALNTPTRLFYMVLDNVPAAGSAIITSSTAFNASATLEYPNEYLAGHVTTKANFFATVAAANFTCFTTLNGSGIAGTGITYSGSLGVQSSATVPTGSASANDTYGVECSPSGGGGGTINFSYEVLLTP